ncbi:MAG: aldehyde dehydrogenase family protein, partial [Candidatus Falkowbacteria bacterium]
AVCKIDKRCVQATEDDWATEYLDLILSVKIVDSFEEALEHIEKYSSRLTDAIVTGDSAKAMEFERQVNSSTVLINASNRLTDGGEFGLGAEFGISTSSIHMRGPMGLEDLTVTKYAVLGDGQIRE